MGAGVFLGKKFTTHPPIKDTNNPLLPALQTESDSPALPGVPSSPEGPGFATHHLPPKPSPGPAPTVAQHRARQTSRPLSPQAWRERPSSRPAGAAYPPSQHRFQPAAFGRCTAAGDLQRRRREIYKGSGGNGYGRPRCRRYRAVERIKSALRAASRQRGGPWGRARRRRRGGSGRPRERGPFVGTLWGGAVLPGGLRASYTAARFFPEEKCAPRVIAEMGGARR